MEHLSVCRQTGQVEVPLLIAPRQSGITAFLLTSSTSVRITLKFPHVKKEFQGVCQRYSVAMRKLG
jgi:hypothetical protein